MVRQRTGDRLDTWLTDVEASGVRELRSFAAGLQRDYAAVKYGLTRPESNRQTEAQIQRLKLLKHHMHGKAGFELLRNRCPIPHKAVSRALQSAWQRTPGSMTVKIAFNHVARANPVRLVANR